MLLWWISRSFATQFVVFNELLTLSSREEVLLDLHIREKKKKKLPNEQVMLKPTWVSKRIRFWAGSCKKIFNSSHCLVWFSLFLNSIRILINRYSLFQLLRYRLIACNKWSCVYINVAYKYLFPLVNFQKKFFNNILTVWALFCRHSSRLKQTEIWGCADDRFWCAGYNREIRGG